MLRLLCLQFPRESKDGDEEISSPGASSSHEPAAVARSPVPSKKADRKAHMD